MDYRIAEDINIIQETLGMPLDELARSINVPRLTLSRIKKREFCPSVDMLNRIYDFAYKKGLKLNRVKSQFYQEESGAQKVVFHGAKTFIEGKISVEKSRERNDFGRGFYCGESCAQAISFIARFPQSCLYVFSFDDRDLRKTEFYVDEEWMLAIAYHRGKLEAYKDHPKIQSIVRRIAESDYLCAPIADNRMFQIIDQFTDGLITDEQCKHCLSATDLGKQYVFLTEKATERLSVLERCFVCELEKQDHQRIRQAEIDDGDNKVKMALAKYKREGKYIEEILR